jgi:hypothetical protein
MFPTMRNYYKKILITNKTGGVSNTPTVIFSGIDVKTAGLVHNGKTER